MLKSLRAFLTAAAAIVALAAVSAPASSVTPWQAHHPRRAQINRRLARQSLRIRRKAANGGMNPARAERLHDADRHVRAQERRMAARNGGYITPRQQAFLNRELDRISRRIRR